MKPVDAFDQDFDEDDGAGEVQDTLASELVHLSIYLTISKKTTLIKKETHRPDSDASQSCQ
jgi:hypothetical protein